MLPGSVVHTTRSKPWMRLALANLLARPSPLGRTSLPMTCKLEEESRVSLEGVIDTNAYKEICTKKANQPHSCAGTWQQHPPERA
eukprot:26143-Pelagomonas_calceolata.AAC.9